MLQVEPVAPPPPPPLPLAIKVINKERLLAKNVYEQRQMVSEIQIQRKLWHCGNTIKLLKIYESEKYINLLMEYQEGGTLGDILEKQLRISEENSRMIVA